MKKTALLAAFVALALPLAGGPPPRTITVMTRNVYPGLDDASGVIAAVESEDPEAILEAVELLWQGVVASDIPDRVRALADEIANAEPAVVGLQEAALWRSEPGADFSGIPDAKRVEYDFVAMLLTDLSARGLRYDVVAVNTNFDLELPRVNLSANGKPHPQDIRWTDRDVVLVRSGEIDVTGSANGTFATVFDAGAGVVISRGWVSADVEVRGVPFRVVSAHLEDEDSAVRLSQAGELLSGPGGSALPTIFIGDYNSNANPDATSAAYLLLIASGLTDAWSAAHPLDPGVTCCQDPTLQNSVSQLTQRMDLVLYRGAFTTLDATLVGADPLVGLPVFWASDHAGLVVKLGVSP